MEEGVKRAKVKVYSPAFFSNSHINVFQPCGCPFWADAKLSLAKWLPCIPVKALYISFIPHMTQASIPLLDRNNTNVENLKAGSKDIAIFPPVFESKEGEF